MRKSQSTIAGLFSSVQAIFLLDLQSPARAQVVEVANVGRAVSNPGDAYSYGEGPGIELRDVLAFFFDNLLLTL
jgi:hypothetical protein